MAEEKNPTTTRLAAAGAKCENASNDIYNTTGENETRIDRNFALQITSSTWLLNGAKDCAHERSAFVARSHGTVSVSKLQHHQGWK
jgi:hypothetical protein